MVAVWGIEVGKGTQMHKNQVRYQLHEHIKLPTRSVFNLQNIS